MNKALETLLELSRRVPMPAEEREAQRRSFAYGNTHFENPLITRDMIERAAAAVDADESASAPAHRSLPPHE